MAKTLVQKQKAYLERLSSKDKQGYLETEKRGSKGKTIFNISSLVNSFNNIVTNEFLIINSMLQN